MVTEADYQNWDLEQLRPYADHVLEQFGTERVMFGSDGPVRLLAASYEQVFGASQVEHRSKAVGFSNRASP